MIVALDLGTTTGYAMHSPGSGLPFVSGSHEVKTTRFDGGGMRYVMFKRWLTDQFGDVGCTWLIYESVRRHLSNDSAHAYGGYLATLLTWCEERKIPYQGVPVQTIKIHATGHGGADKQTMILAALSYGCDPVDDNEADAVCLLQWAMAQRDPYNDQVKLLLSSHSKPRRCAAKPRMRKVSRLMAELKLIEFELDQEFDLIQIERAREAQMEYRVQQQAFNAGGRD